MLVRYETPQSLDASCCGDFGTDADKFWPTFVTKDDAIRWLDETDLGYTRLNVSVEVSKVPEPFKEGWRFQYNSWKKFEADAREKVTFMNARAVMNSTDRYAKASKEWADNFKAIGGQFPGPDPVQLDVPVKETYGILGDIFKMSAAAIITYFVVTGLGKLRKA